MTHPARKRASDFHPRILEFFDGYVHGKLSKRQFITQAGRYAAAGVTGAMLLEQDIAKAARATAGNELRLMACTPARSRADRRR